MKKWVRVSIGLGIAFTVFAIALLALLYYMNQTTSDALSKQENVEIDMSLVADGVYEGSSDGGLVYVEVRVTVENHRISDITILKHDNGLGEAAEAMVEDMVEQNTDCADTVSGATVSSKTIRNAVNEALKEGMKK